MESKTAVFGEQTYADIISQITEEEEVIEEDQDEFQQIPSAAEVASQLTSAMMGLICMIYPEGRPSEIKATDPV